MPQPWIKVDALEDPAHPSAADVVEAATQVLWELSGKRYSGLRTVTETYAQLRPHEVPIDRPTPVLREGRIYNEVGGACGVCMGCTHLVKLRGAPAIELETVRTPTKTIPLRDVALLDYSWVSLSGASLGCWGTCEDLTITYSYGAKPPALARLAVTELANQFIWYLTDDQRCTLPARVINSVSRQGISWTLLDPQDFLQDGRTGLYQVDLFLKAVNPEKRRMRARVFSPDLRSGKTRR